MRLKDQVSEYEAKVKPVPTKIPDLWAIYLLEDKWGMKAGDCMTIATGAQVGKMDKEGLFVYSRRKRSEQVQEQADERMTQEMRKQYIDSRYGHRDSLVKIVESRGEPVGKVLTLYRGSASRGYYLRFKDPGPLQGGISSFLFNQFNLPIEIDYRL